MSFLYRFSVYCLVNISWCLLLPQLTYAQGSVEDQLHKEISKILRFDIEWKKKQTPGFVVHVIEPDTSFTVTFGHEVNSKEMISDERLYGIGGLSKVYTAIAVGYAIQSGSVDTSKTINEIIPDLAITQEITILDLLRHAGGMPRVLKGLNVGRKHDFKEVTYKEFSDAIAQNSIKNKKEFLYNHHGHALLDAWLIAETDRSVKYWYTEAQQEYPLLPDWKEDQETIGLNKQGKEQMSISYGIYTPSLGLYATKNDLELLVRFLLTDTKLTRFIKKEVIKTDIHKTIRFTNGLYYISKGKKHTILGHGGRSVNNSASIHFVPETQKGLVMLYNSETGVNQLYLPILSMINNNWRT